jgi:hypothetical protein
VHLASSSTRMVAPLFRGLPRQLSERQPPGPGNPTNVVDREQLCEATSIDL